MDSKRFILREETYLNGIFPKIPDVRHTNSWFLFTMGVKDNLLVSDKTTVKQIRQGKYQRLIEISKEALTFEHRFKASCKEPTYSFSVHVRAKVSVHDPVRFYMNMRSIDVREFLDNQFLLDVGRITRKYSILNNQGLDEELTEALAAKQVTDFSSIMRYRITSVFTEPSGDAKEALREIDDMKIRKAADSVAYKHMKESEFKTYKDAMLEEVARGKISRGDAILKIEAYQKNGYQDKIKALLQLRDEGFLSDSDVMYQLQFLLPSFQGVQASAPETLCENGIGINAGFRENGE